MDMSKHGNSLLSVLAVCPGRGQDQHDHFECRATRAPWLGMSIETVMVSLDRFFDLE